MKRSRRSDAWKAIKAGAGAGTLASYVILIWACVAAIATSGRPLLALATLGGGIGLLFGVGAFVCFRFFDDV